jgi:hypothetical protein
MRLKTRPRSRLGAAAIVCAMLLAFAATAGLAASARAATYTVGTLEDRTGTCEVPASGSCSLRQLISYENSLLEPPNPPDTIDVPAPEGVAFYDLSNGPLTIYKSVSIVGAGARAVNIFQESSTANRVFVVEPNPRNRTIPTVAISGLSIALGTANANNGYYGGDLLNEGTLTLSEDAITNGTAESGSGGGISNDGGTLTVTHSLVADNISTNPEGGGDSGGIQNFGPNPVTEAAGKLTVNDSTITDNSAALGGGIFSWCGGAEGACSSTGTNSSTTITNSTIANNDGGTRSSEGGGLLASQGTIAVENSIVAGNTVENPLTGERVPSNCGDSGISSLGHNLQSAADCAFTATGDLKDIEPGFLSSGLQDNGGNTDTLALEAASPAVDAIPAGAPGCTGTDQRGIARPQGNGCDIGAYELFQPIEGQQFSEVVGAAAPRQGTTPTIDWGDGTAPSAGKVNATTGQLTGTHTYINEGVYDASFTYTNSDGFPETRPFDVKVQDAPLTATGVSVSATAGTQLSATVATFTHANPAGTASDYTATIDWGDGSSSTAGTVGAAAGGGFEVKGSHTYAATGQYTTTITIDDVGGAEATATGSADVVGLPVGPPVVSNEKIVSVTETTATISFEIDPDGADTTYAIEYGPTTGYGQETAPVDVGATHGAQSLTRTLMGLEPNKLYHFEVLASNSAVPGGVGSGDQSFTTVLPSPTPIPPAPSATNPPAPAPAGPPAGVGVLGFKATAAALGPPVLGKTVNVTPVSGVVYIELPPGATLASLTPAAYSKASLSPFSPFALATQAFAALTEAQAFEALREERAFAALTKGRAFVPLTEARQIPVGSILETTHGVVGITTATTAAKQGKLQSGDFGAGIFKLLQGRREKGLTDLDIIDNHSPRQVCATIGKQARIAARQLSSKVLGRLNASGHGQFSARGQYSAATVRGTTWSVANQCDGTLTHVKRGVVSVRDFRRRKTLTLFTGESYLARAPLK